MGVKSFTDKAKRKIAHQIKLRVAPIYNIELEVIDEYHENKITDIVFSLQQQGFDAVIHQVQGCRFGYVCCTDGEYSALQIVLKEMKDVSAAKKEVSRLEERIIRELFLKS